MPTPSIFSMQLKASKRLGHFGRNTRAAMKWYQGVAEDVYVGDRKAFFKRELAGLTRKGPQTGFMYTFAYDAKTKDKLPVWDRFPLIFMVDTARDGFYGINLHFCAPEQRAYIMDKLYAVASDTRFNDNTKVRLSYKALIDILSKNEFNPMLKRYLVDHVRSPIYKIPGEFWNTALYLQTHEFVKKDEGSVWGSYPKR